MTLTSTRSMDALSNEPMENGLATVIIGSAIEVQRHLGPGLVKSAYEIALCREMQLRGLSFKRQISIAATYKDILLPDAYRIDLLVEDRVIVELKAIEKLLPIHEAQLLTYLRFTDKRLGLLLNFHSMPMKSGIRRVASNL